MLHEEISGEHRAVAKNMSPEERGMRLEELRELRKYWRDQGGTGQKEHDQILRVNTRSLLLIIKIVCTYMYNIMLMLSNF